MDKRRNHIIFWVGFISYYGTLTFIALKDSFPIYIIFFKVVIGCTMTLLMFYYYAFFLFPKTIPKKQYSLLSLGVILSLMIMLIYVYTITVTLQKIFPNYVFALTLSRKPVFPSDTFILTLGRTFMITLFPTIRAIYLALPYWLLDRLFKQFNHNEEIERKFAVLKKTVLDSELLGLKNQINPHFLYNSLNFLYAQALPVSSKQSKSILILAEMMRYSIIENNDKNKISLEQEVDYVKKYIQLENLHLDQNSLIKLDIIGNPKYRQIYPMALQPILESSYKFGNNINFSLEIKENQMCFVSTYVKKSIYEINDIYHHFSNIKRRTPIQYQDCFFINLDSDTLLCKLSLNLNL